MSTMCRIELIPEERGYTALRAEGIATLLILNPNMGLTLCPLPQHRFQEMISAGTLFTYHSQVTRLLSLPTHPDGPMLRRQQRALGIPDNELTTIPFELEGTLMIFNEEEENEQ